MTLRYCFEFIAGSSLDIWFVYFDTPDHLGQFLFEQEKIDFAVINEFGKEGDPYRPVMVRIPAEQRESFMAVMDMLPGLLEHLGKTDYEAFCQYVMMDFMRKTGAKKTAEK